MLTHDELRQFTGTEQWFRHGLVRKVLYTEGVQYLIEKAQAYWLVDKIATMQLEPAIKVEGFQVWNLTVNKDKTAVLSCEDGDGNVLHTESICWTDFPLEHIALWVENGVILLPSEH